MRGKAICFCKDSLVPGITPAYAGKSAAGQQRADDPEDHPRLCGEKECYSDSRSGIGGSPPPMRGKELATALATDSRGITPAYAGKSLCKDCLAACRRDHPRLCGEKPFAFARILSCRGSPPPMRGKAAAVVVKRLLDPGSPPPMRGKVVKMW